LRFARDFSCAIISSGHELIAAAEAIPVHVIGSEALAEAMAELTSRFSVKATRFCTTIRTSATLIMPTTTS